MIRFSSEGAYWRQGVYFLFEKQLNVQNKTLLNICYKRDNLNNRNCNNNKYTISVQLK